MSKEKDSKKDADEQTVLEPKKTCFVIMPIADHPDYDPGHFDRVYQFIIKPACEKANFEPFRADDSKAGHVIMIDILKRILHADMAICDISSRNANVLYELGIRQAFNKPVTLLKDETTKDLFDILGIRYASYNHHLRIDRIEKEIQGLADAITETYEKWDTDVFSLIQFLGMEKAKLDPSNLTPETQLILNAINELQKKNTRLENYPIGYNPSSMLPIYLSDVPDYKPTCKYEVKFSTGHGNTPVQEIADKLRRKHTNAEGVAFKTDPLDNRECSLNCVSGVCVADTY